MFSLRKIFAKPLAWRSANLLAGVLVLAIFAGGAQHCTTRTAERGHDAQWIWAEGDYHAGNPIAFYAVRELDLEAPLPARIAITGDDTYLLYVNGQRIGAGGYRPNAPLDAYQVGEFLQSGVNRILVEVRSRRGAGGLLAEISLDSEAQHIVTDASWRIFRRYHPSLFGGWSMPETGEVPKVWGRPPTGRWRLTAALRHRPIPFQTFNPPAPRQPLQHRRSQDKIWHNLDNTRRHIPALGPQQIFDWGEVVEGFISFNLRFDDGKPGLLYVSDEPPDAQQQSPDAVIVPVPGRHYWEDAHPRRFRYLLLVGVEPASRIEITPLDATAVPDLISTEEHGGVFGIKPPRSYSKAEEEIWKRLEEEAAETASKHP